MAPVLLPLLFIVSIVNLCASAPSNGFLSSPRSPALGDDPPAPLDPVEDSTHLSAQIGGIIGSYAVALVLVAIGLLALSKRRREHLRSGEDLHAGVRELPTFRVPDPVVASENYQRFPFPVQSPKSPFKNFSYPDPLSPTKTERTEVSAYSFPSPTSTVLAPGIDLSVDQSVVAQDKRMAQQQLEDMYKHVMEQETAKEEGREYEGPPLPTSQQPKSNNPASPGVLKRGKSKPANLSLAPEEKKQSRTSSLLSAILSPRKKNQKGVNISSPIMTPMSGTFPRQEGEEMGPMSPRHYAPSRPPPVPSNQLPLRRNTGNAAAGPPTPEMSPTNGISIDGRLDAAVAQNQTTRGSDSISSDSRDDSESQSAGQEPVSAVSNNSTNPLVGLPSSPKPGSDRFPSLPSSPKPGQSFQRPNAPSALRSGGGLPLRAYEPSMVSPRQTTKQTVFTRSDPFSPGAQTPFTGAAVPYSPYQPFSPVVPITPGLVTKADRKRMKKLEPKTPTVEMVKNEDEVW